VELVDNLWQLVINALPYAIGVVPDLIRVQETPAAGGILQRITPDWFELTLFQVGDIAVTVGAIIRFVLIVVAAWWLSKIVQAAMSRVATFRPNFGQAALYTVNRLMHYVILTIGFLVALSSVGIDFGSSLWMQFGKLINQISPRIRTSSSHGNRHGCRDDSDRSGSEYRWLSGFTPHRIVACDL